MDWTSQIFFWILLANAVMAIPVAYVAEERGRSSVGFFFLSFFLSFFVGILVLLALPSNRSLVPEKGAGMDRVTCPFCAELVKKEASVCRFCGRDIVERLEALYSIRQAAAIEAEKVQFQREIVAREELAKATAEQQATRDAARARRKAFYRKPSTIVLAVVAAFVVVAGVIFTPVIANSLRESQRTIEQQRVAAEYETALDGHRDWANLVLNCDEENRTDITWLVSEDNRRLNISGIGPLNVLWHSCVGHQIAANSPDEFTSSVDFTDGLGWYIKTKLASAPGSGAGVPVTLTYGNLNIVVNLPLIFSDPYEILITRE